MQNLKPCPFCGGSAHFMTHPLTGDKYYAVACIKDGCWASDVPDSAICDTEKKAAKLWNKRRG